MGAWSTCSVGNDAALDFIQRLTSSDQLDHHPHDMGRDTVPMDMDRASAALACCDMLAPSIGRPAEDMPDIPSLTDTPEAASVPRDVPRLALGAGSLDWAKPRSWPNFWGGWR